MGWTGDQRTGRTSVFQGNDGGPLSKYLYGPDGERKEWKRN